MANNRVWLVHEPSKLRVALGKRMATGWYGAPDKEAMQQFYDELEDWCEANDGWEQQDKLTLEFEVT